MNTERDPNGIDAHTPGAKLDAGKTMAWTCLSGFANALEQVAEVTTYGAAKYSPNGWKEVPEGEARYMEAFARHLLAFAQGERIDPTTNLSHRAQMVWNLLAAMELEECDCVHLFGGGHVVEGFAHVKALDEAINSLNAALDAAAAKQPQRSGVRFGLALNLLGAKDFDDDNWAELVRAATQTHLHPGANADAADMRHIVDYAHMPAILDAVGHMEEFNDVWRDAGLRILRKFCAGDAKFEAVEKMAKAPLAEREEAVSTIYAIAAVVGGKDLALLTGAALLGIDTLTPHSRSRYAQNVASVCGISAVEAEALIRQSLIAAMDAHIKENP